MLQRKIKQGRRVGWVAIVNKVPRKDLSAKVTQTRRGREMYGREKHSRQRGQQIQRPRGGGAPSRNSAHLACLEQRKSQGQGWQVRSGRRVLGETGETRM